VTPDAGGPPQRSTGPVTIVIVDDHGLFREGVAAILRLDPRIAVVGEGSSAQDAVSLTASLAPDVLLLDAELPGSPARATVARIHRSYPRTRIVMLTMRRSSVLKDELLAAGAFVYLTKATPSAGLVQAVLFAGAVARGLKAAPESARAGRRRTSILSAREQEVLHLLAEARTNRDIAEAMSIAEGTVKRHTSSIYAKLGARSRMEAVRKALLLGIFTRDEL
jgi:DNA-binding NarL/FixJ family response regulator